MLSGAVLAQQGVDVSCCHASKITGEVATQEPHEGEAKGSREGGLLARQCAMADGAAELLSNGAAHGESHS